MSLLADQLRDYSHFHTDRTNLLVHIVAVPVFELSCVAFVGALAARAPGRAVASVALAVAAFAAQGGGHALEPNAAIPFSGPGNALGRIFGEQFVTFPRFVLGGGWSRAYRAAAQGD